MTPLYLPGLNGIRAIAAFFVVFAHITQRLDKFGLDRFIFGSDPNGNTFGAFLAGIGVAMFFTLSGFLITFLLLSEKSSGSISLKNFYMRRILRIWPLYFFYLLICLVVIYFIDFESVSYNLWYYILIAANIPFIFGGTIPLLSHYWSLAVEEQFYLIWPILSKLISMNKMLLYLLVSFGVLMFAKVIFKFIDVKFGISEPFYFLYVNRYDCMIIGAIAAVIYYQKKSILLGYLTSKLSQTIALLIICFFCLNGTMGDIISHEVASVATVIIILSQIESSQLIISLENPLLNFLGKISFGIYVYHLLLIHLLSKVIHFTDLTNGLSYLFVYAIVISTTILISYLSYKFLESPFLKVKNNFAIIKSTN